MVTHEQPEQALRHFIIGTAGHIDHGKTSLVRALTGIDTDRLPEEQQRGMTIELGFAHLTLDGTQFGIVDVPGHERFVRTMVAGATGINLALLVVAADDSIMPQTIEHLEILNLLGVSRGVVAVTKIDTVDEELVELVCEEVRELLEGGPLEGSQICRVSSVTGEGLEDLKRAIVSATEGIEGTPTDRPFRMAVDRVFTVQGRGTVVTGSALRGEIATGDTLEIRPGGQTCRVRDLQAHGIHWGELGRGQRVAVNISGADREQLARGVELVTPGYLQPSRTLDVRLTCLAALDKPLKSPSNVRLCIGTMEVPVRIVLYGRASLEPGGSCYAQLRCGQSLAATFGQRLIIRDESATRTIGGGMVLKPLPRRKRRAVGETIDLLEKLEHGNAADRVEQVLRDSRFTTPTDLHMTALSGVELADLPAVYRKLRAEKRWIPVPPTGCFAVPATLEDIAARLTNWLTRFHESHPDEPGRHVDAVVGWLARLSDRTLAKPLLERMIQDKTLKPLGRFICLAAFAPALSNADERMFAAMIEEYRSAHLKPPSLETATALANADPRRRERLATLAIALGELVRIDAKLFLHAEAERAMRTSVADLIAKRGGVTVAEVREALNSSRKYVVPFLEHLDRQGFTKRTGDHRILTETTAGPS